MKETTPAAMPLCFERWCKRFDDVWTHQAQKWEFRNYFKKAKGGGFCNRIYQGVLTTPSL
jgi:hypothetical protein